MHCSALYLAGVLGAICLTLGPFTEFHFCPKEDSPNNAGLVDQLHQPVHDSPPNDQLVHGICGH